MLIVGSGRWEGLSRRNAASQMLFLNDARQDSESKKRLDRYENSLHSQSRAQRSGLGPKLRSRTSRGACLILQSGASLSERHISGLGLRLGLRKDGVASEIDKFAVQSSVEKDERDI